MTDIQTGELINNIKRHLTSLVYINYQYTPFTFVYTLAKPLKSAMTCKRNNRAHIH